MKGNYKAHILLQACAKDNKHTEAESSYGTEFLGGIVVR